jgi:hypothetical protein
VHDRRGPLRRAPAAGQGAAGETDGEAFRTEHGPAAARESSDETREALDELMEAAATDPESDEELFVDGIRRLIDGFR